MEELLFVVGALIGWAFGFFPQQRKYQKIKTTELSSENQLTKAQHRIQDLETQLARVQQPKESMPPGTADLQAKTQELQTVTDQLAAAENQVATLRQQLIDAETTAQTTIAEKTTEVQNLQAELHQVQQKLASAEQQIDTLQAQLADRTPPPTDSAPPPDDLRTIEGIGPKVAQILHEYGIATFAQLAQTDTHRLRAILEEAGPPFKGMDPESWPEQARLAAQGEWDALKSLQDELDGGRYKSS
jgi:predicted flap endonuclease-1-like 5' DNA nuclease